jgi:DNA-binding MarR family transcriptional regulator
MSRPELERLNRLIQEMSTETVLLHQAVADRLGLNVTDHKALGLLLEEGKPITPGQLATRTGLTTGAVTGIVDRLEKAGFVRRKRDPEDRRQVSIEINLDKVRRVVFPIFEELSRRMSTVAASYSQKDLDTIMGFMERGIAIARSHRAKLQDR